MDEQAQTYTAISSIVINSPVHEVWSAITTPETIKKYFFGTDVSTDWEVGSEITYTGVWEGQTYTDKGQILEKDEQRKLVMSYWTPSFGEDNSENYQQVSYELDEVDGKTRLTVSQSGITDAQSRDHTKSNWDLILIELKKLLENPTLEDQPKLAA